MANMERMLAGWHDGEVQDIHLDMMRFALEIVSKSLFSVELTADTHRIARALNTFMELGGRARAGVCYYLQFFACSTADNIRYRRAARQLDDIVNGLIQRRRANAEIADDLLSGLLQAQGIGRRAMSDGQLRDEVMTLLLAGHETTAVSRGFSTRNF